MYGIIINDGISLKLQQYADRQNKWMRGLRDLMMLKMRRRRQSCKKWQQTPNKDDISNCQSSEWHETQTRTTCRCTIWRSWQRIEKHRRSHTSAQRRRRQMCSNLMEVKTDIKSLQVGKKCRNPGTWKCNGQCNLYRSTTPPNPNIERIKDHLVSKDIEPVKRISTDKMLADPLTKLKADLSNLINLLRMGIWERPA